MTRRLLVATLAPSIFAVTLAAQSSPLTFEVASIKRNVDPDPGGSVRIDPGNRLTVTNIPLTGLVRHAGVCPCSRTSRWSPRSGAAHVDRRLQG